MTSCLKKKQLFKWESQFLSHLTMKLAVYKRVQLFSFLVNNSYEALQLGKIVCYADDS